MFVLFQYKHCIYKLKRVGWLQEKTFGLVFFVVHLHLLPLFAHINKVLWGTLLFSSLFREAPWSTIFRVLTWLVTRLSRWLLVGYQRSNQVMKLLLSDIQLSKHNLQYVGLSDIKIYVSILLFRNWSGHFYFESHSANHQTALITKKT